MEKVIFYRVWYFEDFYKHEKYYFENKEMAEIARFNAYKSYDYNRLTIRHFVVPLSMVKSELIHENDINKIKLYVIKEKDEDAKNL